MSGRDTERLGQWIEFPATPTEVVWQVRRISHPSVKPPQYSLSAVLSFEREDAEEIVSESPLLEPKRNVFVDEIPVWFPEEARREMVRTGDDPAEGYYFGGGNLSHASDEFDGTKFRGGHVVRVGNSDMIYINVLSD